MSVQIDAVDFRHDENTEPEEFLEQADALIEADPDIYLGYYYRAKAAELLLDKEAAYNFYGIAENLSKDLKIPNNVYQDIKNVGVNLMKRWIIKSGGKINNINVHFFDVDYRGLMISGKVKSDTKLVEVPLKCCVLYSDCIKSGISEKIFKDPRSFKLTMHNYLAIELLNINRNPKDQRNYYIECLPKFFGNIPIFFKENPLDLLYGSYAIYNRNYKEMLIKHDFNTIFSIYPKFPYSYFEFKWARTAVITRVYSCKTKEMEKNQIMVPFADMANHNIKPNTVWRYDDDVKKFIIKTNSILEDGEEFLETYGPKSNYRYFNNYGFTIYNNIYEKAFLLCNPKCNLIDLYDPSTFVEKFVPPESFLELGYTITNYEEMFNKYKSLNTPAPDNDTSNKDALAFNALNEYVAEFSKKILKFKDNEILQISLKIYKKIKEALQTFRTSIEQDIEIIEKVPDLSFNYRNCIVQRCEEKKVLRFNMILLKGLISHKIEENKVAKNKIKKQLIKHLNKHIKTSDVNEQIDYLKALLS